MNSSCKILGVATQGPGGGEENRLRHLTSGFPTQLFAYDRNSKLRNVWRLLRAIREAKPDLVVMEGTGSAAGITLLLARWLYGVPFVVSSGDAVGPYIGSRVRWLRLPFQCYERALYRHSAGFIGWTPYLVGRALTWGAPRAITAAGWCDDCMTEEDAAQHRIRIRAELGIPDDAIVFGIAGWLAWNRRYQFCYGRELVDAIRRVQRKDVAVLIVGDGDGRIKLAELAGDLVGRQVFFTGKVQRDEIPSYLAAMDVGSLPQSVDQVGSFRYTTKISEYVACGLPVVTGEIPFAYDFDAPWILRLAGDAPWDPRYVASLTELMQTISWDTLQRKRRVIPTYIRDFDREDQVARVTGFLADLLSKQSSNAAFGGEIMAGAKAGSPPSVEEDVVARCRS